MRNNRVATLMLSSLLFLIGFGCSAKANTEIELSVTTAAPHILVVSFIDDYNSASLATDPLTTTISDWKVNGETPQFVYHRRASIDEKPKTKNGEYPILKKILDLSSTRK